MSRLIDYDAQFREYFNSWYEKNKQDYLGKVGAGRHGCGGAESTVY